MDLALNNLERLICHKTKPNHRWTYANLLPTIYHLWTNYQHRLSLSIGLGRLEVLKMMWHAINLERLPLCNRIWRLRSHNSRWFLVFSCHAYGSLLPFLVYICWLKIGNKQYQPGPQTQIILGSGLFLRLYWHWRLSSSPDSFRTYGLHFGEKNSA